MFSSKGILSYGPEERVLIWVDRSIAEYYRSLIPKYIFIQPQKYPAHITVVRSGRETPDMSHWGKYEGEEIEFAYDGKIKFDGGVYYYLDVICERIAEIRMELGLPRYRFGDNKKYHITIGNSKSHPPK